MQTTLMGNIRLFEHQVKAGKNTCCFKCFLQILRLYSNIIMVIPEKDISLELRERINLYFVPKYTIYA